MQMINKVIIFLVIAVVWADASFSASPVKKKPLVVNLFGTDNGKGLETDRKILKEALINLGCEVIERSYRQHNRYKEKADINIFLERINPQWLSDAKFNWLIPNPEWYTQAIELLDEIDLILCRTHEVERIFQALNKQTYFLSFTSYDCYLSEIQKDRSTCVHLAGGSDYKGSDAIIEAWRQNPLMPNLVFVTHNRLACLEQDNLRWFYKRLSLEDLHYYQNHCGVHLCPSEVEGFGHYIMEAMSAKAVVITTDAPPMNEHITDPRCLVPYHSTAPSNLGIRYFVDHQQLETTIQLLMSLPPEELELIGERNREVYLQKTKEFHDNLKSLIKKIKTVVSSQ
jgi:glycosyltransferase involved in cell wall biosynthesis